MLAISRRWALAAAILAGGCATFEEKPLEPEKILEDLRSRSVEGLRLEPPPPDDAGPGVPPAFDLSNGLDDAEVAAVALVLNPGLRARRLEVGEAQAELIAAGVWPNPEVDVAVRPGLGGVPGPNVDAGILFELLRPWERAARKEAAARGIDEARAEVAAEEWRVATEARLARIEVVTDRRALRLLDDEVVLRKETLDLVRRRRDAGEGTELDAAAAALDLAEAERERRRARAGLEESRGRLDRILGLPPSYAVPLEEEEGPVRVTVLADLPDADIDRRLLAGRPELRAKEAEYRKVEAELHLAIYRQYPRVKLGPSYQLEDRDSFLGVGASVEIPLFDRNQGEIARLESRRDAGRAAFEDLLHRLRAEAHAARAAVRSAREDLEAGEKEVEPAIAGAQALLDGAFRARELKFLDWVTARTRILAARREQLRAVRRYREAAVTLEAAIGTPLGRSAAGPPATAGPPPAAGDRRPPDGPENEKR